MGYQEPSPAIAERIKQAKVKVKVGQKVLVTKKDGSQYLAEIEEFDSRIKGWITKVRVYGKDGYTIQEVSDLIVDAVLIVRDITLSDVGRAIAQFFRNLFSKN